MRSPLVSLACTVILAVSALAADRPNVVLVMTDDQGWGQTGYYGHAVLKTPNLDKMAESGLRFDRFYAGAPNCSPTRATVLTGRSNDRTGVYNHGVPLRRAERTIAQALRDAGYATAHFGKWHLNGLRGAGAPVQVIDPRHPGHFGFDEWLSVTNFFDRDPIMSRNGAFVALAGDSSEIIVDEALKFIGKQAEAGKPFFVVIWYGTPHSPFVAAEEDMRPFQDQDEKSRNQHGELVAMDRSIGTLRAGLRRFGVAENTLLWFNSDNGGLPEITPSTVGGLRGFKNTVYEGGLRVPGIVEWPAVIKPRVTEFPAVTMDIFPTIAEAIGLSATVVPQPCDGMSLRALFDGEIGSREKPIPFRHTNRAALIDNNYKLVTQHIAKGKYELYDLVKDEKETTDLFASMPDVAERMRAQFEAWNQSVEDSIAGKDFPPGTDIGEGASRNWPDTPEYQPYLEILR